MGDDPTRLARLALEEDGARDITTQVTIDPRQTATARLEYRSGGVLAGIRYADAVAHAAGLPPICWDAREGDRVAPGREVATLEGPLAALLRAERPLLNLLQRGSGIATATREFVGQVAGTGCRVLHTRKTAPGLRQFDVSAVLAGGGEAHRLDLAQVVMVKDNHWRSLERGGRTLTEALDSARRLGVSACYVEVESPGQVHAACAAGATRLLVDNQRPETVREWATLARRLAPGIEIEATGGITLENVRSFAEAGADFVSIGALTHSVQAADLSLEVGDIRAL